jgi:hypothetical protein
VTTTTSSWTGHDPTILRPAAVRPAAVCGVAENGAVDGGDVLEAAAVCQALLGTFATVLARVIDGSPPGARGWHPHGLADASGFAAMACDELLVHTDDSARGLGVPFAPPTPLVRATLERLFPWAPAGADPWPALLWSNGRVALPGHPRQARWRWHCAPLEEWDGVNPADRR